LEIKQLSIVDYDDIISLWQETGLSYRPNGRDTRENMQRQMQDWPDLFLGAFEGEMLIGTVIGSDDGRRGYINRLAVRPSHQGKGMASMLLSAVEEALESRGREIYCSLVEDRNEESIQFFLSQGYAQHDDIIYFSKRKSQDV
jgi:ribosomal protein S18 acetylase RimI-like enzyme